MTTAGAALSPVLEAWLGRRSRFHHDWLNNRFRPFLHARRAALEECEIFGTALEDSLAEQLREWEAHFAEGAALVAEAGEALSPAQQVDCELFAGVGEPLRAWMRETVAALHRDRSNLAQLVAAAEAALREADRLYREVSARVLAPTGS